MYIVYYICTTIYNYQHCRSYEYMKLINNSNNKKNVNILSHMLIA